AGVRNEALEGSTMCPVCIASAAVLAAGAGSTGGMLAVFIGKIRNFFMANGLNLFQEISVQENQGDMKWQQATRKRISQSRHRRSCRRRSGRPRACSSL